MKPLNLRTISMLLKTAGLALVVCEYKWGVVLCLASWYMLDYFYFTRIKRSEWDQIVEEK